MYDHACSIVLTPLMQELGRLCRYPTATAGPDSLSLKLKVSQDWQAAHESCLKALGKALVYMYDKGESTYDDDPITSKTSHYWFFAADLDPHWEGWATAVALACSTQFAVVIRALNQQQSKLETASQALQELGFAVSGLVGLPGANEVRHLCQQKVKVGLPYATDALAAIVMIMLSIGCPPASISVLTQMCQCRRWRRWLLLGIL